MKAHDGYQFSDKELRGYAGYLCTFVQPEDLRGKNVLDVGCGFGWFERYADINGVGHVTGVEHTDEGLQVARSTAVLATERISFQKASALELKTLNKTYDTVVSWEVIEHLPKNTEKALFQSVYPVLKPNGCFYLSTPYWSLFSNLFDPAWYFGHRHYRAEELKKYAADAGFLVEQTKTVGGWVMIGSMLNHYISKWIFRRAPMCEDWWLQKLELDLHKEKGFCVIVLRCRKPKEII